MVKNQQQSYKGKARWHVSVKLPSNVLYLDSVSLMDLKKFMAKYPELRKEDADIVNKYVIPFILHQHKNSILKSIKVTRLT